MRILVTTARMPFAVGLVRRLGEAGHTVLASDTYMAAPGSHSRYVSGQFVTPAPRLDPPGFVSAVGRIAAENGVDAIVPAWEDVFYLSAPRAKLPAELDLYAAQFPTLARPSSHSSSNSLFARRRGRSTTWSTCRTRMRAGTIAYPSCTRFSRWRITSG